jgi:hypothetical protein
MNEIRRAGLEQLAMTIEAAMGQLTSLLDAERQDIQDIPDNIEESDFAVRILKRPLFELSAARVHMLESIEHISIAIAKTSPNIANGLLGSS